MLDKAEKLVGIALTFEHRDIVEWFLGQMSTAQKHDLLCNSLYFITVASKTTADNMAYFLSCITKTEKEAFLQAFNYRLFRFSALNGKASLMQLIWESTQASERSVLLQSGDYTEYDALFSAVMNDHGDVVEQLYQWSKEIGAAKNMLSSANYRSFCLALTKQRCEIVDVMFEHYREQGLLETVNEALKAEVLDFVTFAKPKQQQTAPEYWTVLTKLAGPAVQTIDVVETAEA